MLNKNNEVKWMEENKASFACIKKVIKKAPILASPDYLKYFLIFLFTSEHIVVAVLLSKNEEGFEQPIIFFSKSLRDVELRYDIMEKQAYTMVKALKAIRTYVLHSKVIAYMPTNSVKYILVQPDNDGKRGWWLAKIQEFDLEVKPTKLVKGQGLAKLSDESNFRSLRMNDLQGYEGCGDVNELDYQIATTRIEEKFSLSGWYKDIVSYLLTLKCPNNLSPSRTRTLKSYTVKYCISKSKLYWKDPLGFLLVCLVESETGKVINEFHEGVCGGHHAWRVTSYKILRAGYYWPRLFSYVNNKVRACNPC
jgi:hypothetical protein